MPVLLDLLDKRGTLVTLVPLVHAVGRALGVHVENVALKVLVASQVLRVQ